VKISSDIGRWLNDDKRSLWLDLAIYRELGFEKPFLLPPRIPCRFYGGWVIGFVLGIVEGFDDLATC